MILWFLITLIKRKKSPLNTLGSSQGLYPQEKAPIKGHLCVLYGLLSLFYFAHPLFVAVALLPCTRILFLFFSLVQVRSRSAEEKEALCCFNNNNNNIIYYQQHHKHKWILLHPLQ
eukprot:gene1627-996_t